VLIQKCWTCGGGRERFLWQKMETFYLTTVPYQSNKPDRNHKNTSHNKSSHCEDSSSNFLPFYKSTNYMQEVVHKIENIS
jgi:hypothetical protein